MKTGILAAGFVAALFSLGAAQAQSCSSTCNSKHTTCAKSGKDYSTCMTAWHQCKTACVTPARSTPAPAPTVTKAVVRH